jgi:hypothetical protein
MLAPASHAKEGRRISHKKHVPVPRRKAQAILHGMPLQVRHPDGERTIEKKNVAAPSTSIDQSGHILPRELPAAQPNTINIFPTVTEHSSPGTSETHNWTPPTIVPATAKGSVPTAASNVDSGKVTRQSSERDPEGEVNQPKLTEPTVGVQYPRSLSPKATDSKASEQLLIGTDSQTAEQSTARKLDNQEPFEGPLGSFRASPPRISPIQCNVNVHPLSSEAGCSAYVFQNTTKPVGIVKAINRKRSLHGTMVRSGALARTSTASHMLDLINNIIEEQQQQLEANNVRIQDLANELTGSKSSEAVQKAHLKAAQEENIALVDRLKHSEDKLADLARRSAGLRTALDGLGIDLQALNQMGISIDTRTTELRLEAATSKTEREQLLEACTACKATSTSLHAAVLNMRTDAMAQVQELESRCQRLQEEANDNCSLLEEKQQHCQDLQAQLKSTSDAYNKLQELSTNQSSELQSSLQSREVLRRELAEVQKSNTALKEDCTLKVNALAKLKEQLQAADTNAESLCTRLGTYEADVMELRLEVERGQAKSTHIHDLEQQNMELAQQLSDVSERLQCEITKNLSQTRNQHTLTQRLEELQIQLESIGDTAAALAEARSEGRVEV